MALVPLSSLACVLARAQGPAWLRRARVAPVMELLAVVLPAGLFWQPSPGAVCACAAVLLAACAAALPAWPCSCPDWSGRLRWGSS